MRPGESCTDDCTIDCGHCKGRVKRRVIIELTCERKDALNEVVTRVSSAARVLPGIEVMNVRNEPWGR